MWQNSIRQDEKAMEFPGILKGDSMYTVAPVGLNSSCLMHASFVVLLILRPYSYTPVVWTTKPQLDSVSGMDTEDLTSRVEEWSSRFQEEIDMDKATVEAVNTFMVVVCN